MRSEQELYTLIVNTARNDERIRAVIMNGSRTDPNSPRDIFQDYDIVYIVTAVSSFKHDLNWIKRFGEVMIMQMPDDMLEPPPSNDGSFAFLMQFTDGNRIDLTLFPLTRTSRNQTGHKTERTLNSISCPFVFVPRKSLLFLH